MRWTKLAVLYLVERTNDRTPRTPANCIQMDGGASTDVGEEMGERVIRDYLHR